MYKKYISFSLLVFSLNIYSSETRLVRRKNNTADQVYTADQIDFSSIEQKIQALRNDFQQSNKSQQQTTFFYELPSQTQPAQQVITSQQEIAQQQSVSATNILSKFYKQAITTLVTTECKLSLAEAARYGHFPKQASQDIEAFAENVINETEELLLKFQNNNKESFKEEHQIDRTRKQKNKAILNDVNAILANLSKLEPKDLKSKNLQRSLDRTLQNIENKLKEQLEIIKLRTEENLNETSDITKYLEDLTAMRTRLCTTNNNTNFSELIQQFDTYFNGKK